MKLSSVIFEFGHGFSPWRVDFTHAMRVNLRLAALAVLDSIKVTHGEFYGLATQS